MTTIYRIEEYREASSVTEALALLAENPERRILAGGTDLFIKLRNGELQNAALVGIREISALRAIEQNSEGSIGIGPMATFSDLIAHDLIATHMPILAEAALTVGGPQIRGMATLGGNICNGVPSADSAPVLFALNAEMALQSSSGQRIIPIDKFYLGPGRVDLRPGEMLTELIVRKEHYHAFSGAYIKFSPRKAMDLAILGVAAMCRLNGEEEFEAVRIALGVAGPTPLRCPAAEDYALGKPVNEEILQAIGKKALEAAAPRSSRRASRAYREHLIQALTARALKLAVERAKEKR